MRLFEPILGGLLIALICLDVFLTVLYARVGTGVISHQLARATWRAFRALSQPFKRNRDAILSFCGPTILVLLVTTWLLGLMCGVALVIHPALGTSISSSADAATPRDFFTALYIAGDSMTTVGASNLKPHTPFYRMLFTFTALMGLSMITLVLTYFLEIYNSLQQRNTYAVKLHHASGGTGDAAELIAGVGAHGQFQAGYAHLAEMSAETIQLFEAHHFYAVLLYFRFKEPYYALSRIALMTLDTASLIKSALDDKEHAWVKESAAVSQMWRSSMAMLTELAVVFLPGGLPDDPEPDAATRARWRERHRMAIERLRQAGIQTIADESSGAESYIALRAKWDRYLKAFAGHMAHDVEQIDPVGADPSIAQSRPDFAQRLRAAG